MMIARSLATVALLLVGACRARPPAAASPQASMFCSSAYPYGIAQEHREQSPPTFRVSYEQPFHPVDDVVILGHFERKMNEVAAWSGTRFETAYGETPHLIIELSIHNAGDSWNLAAKIQGREDMRASTTSDGPQDARILFTLSIGPFEYLVPLLETTAAEIAQYVAEGWTCEGDFPKHARRFGE